MRSVRLSVTVAALALGIALSGGALAADLPFAAVQPELFAVKGSLANAWADFDRDGDLDLAVSTSAGAILLYRNDDGRFTSIGADLGLPTGGYELRSLGWGDYDGDGWPDLQAGPGRKAPDQPTLIFRNLRGKRFEEVGARIGLAIADRSARHSNWVDFDNDGDLDFYATDRVGVNRLFRNDGGRFVEVPASEAPADARPTVGACWFDFDRDGDLDLFTANQAGAQDGLWRNDNGRFTDVAALYGVDNAGRDKTEGGVGCAVGDFDNDGFLDLFVPNYGRNALYRGSADGHFTNVAETLGVGVENHAVGAAWGDYDNDGWVDLFVSSYVGGSGQQQPRNALFRNLEGKRFQNVLAENAPVNAADHGVAWVDIDRDGALDLSLTDGYGPVGGHPVFRNTLPGADARRGFSVLVLDSKGRSVVPGAEVRVFDAAGRILGTRQVETAGGYSSQSLAPVYFGLPASSPLTVEVTFMTREGRHSITHKVTDPSRMTGRPLIIRAPAPSRSRP